MHKQPEQKRQEAEERSEARSVLSDAEQIKILKRRPGASKREIARLASRGVTHESKLSADERTGIKLNTKSTDNRISKRAA